MEIGTHCLDIIPEPCVKPVPVIPPPLAAEALKVALRSKFGPPPPEKTPGEKTNPPQKWSTSSFIR